MDGVTRFLQDNQQLLLGSLDLSLLLAASKVFLDNTRESKKRLGIIDIINQQRSNLSQLETKCASTLARYANIPLNGKSPLDLERDEEGQSALMIACRYGKLEAAKLLLSLGANDTEESDNGWKPIHFSCQTDDKSISNELVQHLVKLRADNATEMNTMNQWTPLHIAVSKGNMLQTRLFVDDHQADVNCEEATGLTPLIIAACNGFTDITEYLISKGANLNNRATPLRKSALTYAILNKRDRIAKMLIDAGADLTIACVNGNTPLHDAAISGNVDMVRYLLKHGADVNAARTDGANPVHMAAAQGHSAIVQLLLEHGTPLHGKTRFGQTPLHQAIYYGHVETVKLLLEAKSDPNAKDNDGIGPLHTLCRAFFSWTKSPEDLLEIAKMLLDHGANLDQISHCTPLHSACCIGEKGLPILKFLLQRGANPTLESSQGWSALHFAYSYDGCPQAVKILENHLKKHYPTFLATFDRNKPKDLSRSTPPVCTLTEEQRKEVLGGSPTLEAIAERIKSGKCNKIVVLTGAGISVSAGIPDFRNPKSGIYSSETMRKYNLPSPSAAFDLQYIQMNPHPFYSLCKDIFLPVRKGIIKPTPSHYFIRLLEKKGILLRNYTQNIDNLERSAGLSDESLIEAHGSFNKAYCMSCRKPADITQFWDSIEMDDVPSCASCGGTIRPDVVFFGEGVNTRFLDNRLVDLRASDLLIIMGTSLVVYPFAGLVNEVSESTPRLLINKDAVGVFKSYEDPDNAQYNYRDVSYLGTCDDGILELVRLLGWQQEFEELQNSNTQ